MIRPSVLVKGAQLFKVFHACLSCQVALDAINIFYDSCFASFG
jgi:hypothetical protein